MRQTLLAVLVLSGLLAAFAIPPPQHSIYSDNFNEYTGYLTANASAGAQLFYWFTESQNQPSSDPFVLWLQGGPGCSSLIGLFNELGPYKVTPSLTLEPNPYSWNKIANVLFLDQPVATGFSYLQQTDGIVINQEQMAENVYTALQNFFTQYPQFLNNPFISSL